MNRIYVKLIFLLCSWNMASISYGIDYKGLIQKAKDHVAEENFGMAHKVYDEALSENPGNKVIMSAKADVFILEKRYDDAIALATEAHNIDPNYDWPLAILRTAYIRKQDYDKAYESIEKLRGKVSERKFNVFLAGYYHSIKDFDKAEAHYAKARAIEEDDGVLEMSAWNRKLAGDPIGNQHLNERRIALNHNNYRAHLDLAFAYRDRKMYNFTLQNLDNSLNVCLITGNCAKVDSLAESNYLIGGELSSIYPTDYPIGLGLSLQTTFHVVAAENLLRIVQGANKNPRVFEDLVPPSQNQVHDLEAVIVYHEVEKTPQKWTLRQSYAAEQGKKFSINKQTYVKGEFFHNSVDPIWGDLLYVPYVEFTVANANAGSASNADFNVPYGYKMFGFGLRVESSPNYNAERHKVIAGVRHGQVEATKSEFGVYRLYYEYKNNKNLSLLNNEYKIPWWTSAEYLRIKRYSSNYTGHRWSFKGNAILQPIDKLALFGSQEFVFHKEVPFNRAPYSTNLSITQLTATRSFKPFSLKLTNKYTRGLQFHAYDNLETSLAFEYSWETLSSRLVDGKEFEHSPSSKVWFGVKRVTYLDMAKDLVPHLDSYFLGINFFK